jgi:hypothetical protein
MSWMPANMKSVNKARGMVTLDGIHDKVLQTRVARVIQSHTV